METATGAGSLFGIATARGRGGVYLVDDGDNTLKILESTLPPEDGDGGD